MREVNVSVGDDIEILKEKFGTKRSYIEGRNSRYRVIIFGGIITREYLAPKNLYRLTYM